MFAATTMPRAATASPSATPSINRWRRHPALPNRPAPVRRARPARPGPGGNGRSRSRSPRPQARTLRRRGPREGLRPPVTRPAWPRAESREPRSAARPHLAGWRWRAAGATPCKPARPGRRPGARNRPGTFIDRSAGPTIAPAPERWPPAGSRATTRTSPDGTPARTGWAGESGAGTAGRHRPDRQSNASASATARASEPGPGQWAAASHEASGHGTITTATSSDAMTTTRGRPRSTVLLRPVTMAAASSDGLRHDTGPRRDPRRTGDPPGRPADADASRGDREQPVEGGGQHGESHRAGRGHRQQGARPSGHQPGAEQRNAEEQTPGQVADPRQAEQQLQAADVSAVGRRGRW